MRTRFLLAAALMAAHTMAQDTFVIVKTDGTTLKTADKAVVAGTEEAWTLAGNALAIDDRIERAPKAAATQTITFEDCVFPTNKHNNMTSGGESVYTEKGATFKVQEKYGMFSGAMVSEESQVSAWDSEYPGSASPNKVITTDASTPAGTDGSAKFSIFRFDKYVSGTLNGLKPEFAFDEQAEHLIRSIAVNNTAETWQNCKIGYYSKPAFAEGDFLEVIFTGYDKNGAETGSVTAVLADFRDGKTYICNEWTTVDLSSLGNINRLTAGIQASDAYTNIFSTSFGVCVDNIVFE